jgi:hypothetical protein
MKPLRRSRITAELFDEEAAVHPPSQFVVQTSVVHWCDDFMRHQATGHPEEVNVFIH